MLFLKEVIMVKKNEYRVLLYYKYVKIDDPVIFADEHKEFCEELDIRGRILISNEGINGTLSGTIEQADKYMNYMHSNPLFSDMSFKIDEHNQHAFKKLIVKPRNELVSWKLKQDISPTELTGQRLSPEEFYEHLQCDDVLVIDGRNKYEYDIGHFRGAIRPDVETSREFPEWIRKNLVKHKDKKVITYCTGGIRCEKLTGILLQEGFKDVSQLDGGIVTYGKDPETKGRLFDGKCYVFDERISVSINQVDDTVIGTCYHCGKPEDKYINCEYDFCHLQHIVCKECEIKYNHYCSSKCEEIDTHKRNVAQ